MIETYEVARDLVRIDLASAWEDDSGALYVAEQGSEDDEAYFVPWGAREWLVDKDPSYILMTGVSTFVVKETGEIQHLPAMATLYRIAKMRPTEGMNQ